MDLLSIVSGLLPYVKYSLIFMFIMLIGYFIFRRFFHKKYPISHIQFILIVLLICWGVVVLGITTLSRPAFFTGQLNLSIFSGYVNAWNNWSFSEFQLILFNMLMFVPLGVLLPLLHRKNKSFGRVFLLSITFTLSIEVIQLVTGRGIFELDDLLHNTVGSLAGYFFVMVFILLKEQRKLNLAAIGKAISIPLFFVGLFGVATVVYNGQEFGNLPFKPAQTQKMENINVVLETELSTNSSKACVYYNEDVKDRNKLEMITQSIAHQFDLQPGKMRLEGENRHFPLTDEEGMTYGIDSRMLDGSWSFSTHNISEEPFKGDIEQQKVFFESWLKEENLLPTNAQFVQQDERSLRWILDEPTNVQSSCEDFTQGFILITLSNQSIPESIMYYIQNLESIVNKEIISEQQAFESILDGEFWTFNPLQKGDTLTVTDVQLNYTYDTKGYFQPVYVFNSIVNNEDYTVEISIPAIQ